MQTAVRPLAISEAEGIICRLDPRPSVLDCGIVASPAPITSLPWLSYFSCYFFKLSIYVWSFVGSPICLHVWPFLLIMVSTYLARSLSLLLFAQPMLAQFKLYPAVSPKLLVASLYISSGCVVALNATINCDQDLFQMAGDADAGVNIESAQQRTYDLVAYPSPYRQTIQATWPQEDFSILAAEPGIL